MKLERFGSDGVGLRVTGNPKNAEPEFARIEFPGGQVEVVRARDGEDADYWVHFKVYNSEHPDRFDGDGLEDAKVTDARLDIIGRHTSDVNIGDFEDPNLYHFAIRVSRDKI